MNKPLPAWIIGLTISGILALPAAAAPLSPAAWHVGSIQQTLPPPTIRVVNTNSTDTNVTATATDFSVVCDKNPATSVILTNLASYTKSPSLMIDLGQSFAVDRVVICGQNNGLRIWTDASANSTTLPMGLVVAYVGDSPKAMTNVGNYMIPYDAGNPISQPMDIRFSPANGRYVKLELQTRVNWTSGAYAINSSYGWTDVTQPADRTWEVSEVEIFGSTNLVATNAVVLAASAPAPLKLAASELSYYLSELTGQPHPIITPAQTNSYPGTLYVIADLKSLAPDFPTMTNNIALGLLPANEVNVTKSGRVVTFKGWPYRCVLWSVWEFLERQGVHWTAPDVHGEYVPLTGVNLAILPLTMQSTAKTIYANWDVQLLEPWPHWIAQSLQPGYLYVWRNRWTCGWNSGLIGGDEVPVPPTSGSIAANYAEGMDGYPHNLSTVVPDRILGANPSWWGSLDGVNFSPTGVQLSLASSGAASWIANKIKAWDAYSPLAKTKYFMLNPLRKSYNVLPVDAARFSIDPASVAANALYSGTNSSIAWITGSTHSGGAYYKMISTVANLAPNQLIGGLAYADVFDPPKSNYPANVQMDVCLYGSPNLPFTAPANTEMKSALETWRQRCSKLSTYDYALLFVDWWQTDPRVPVPMVTALVDRARYLASIGAQNGGTQALLGAPEAVESLKYNPWDFYAYPRARWNTNQTGDQILNDFFTGYYREAAAPMLAYYKAMENNQYSNNVSMHFLGYCYWAMPGAFPLPVLNEMNTQLAQARAMATNWYVINRLNEAKASFDWLLLQCGVTNTAMLTNYTAYPSVPTSGTYTVTLTKFSNFNIPHNYYYDAIWNEGGNQSWNFDGAAIIKQPLNFAKAGRYRVDVSMRCSYSDGTKYPTLRVFLGPTATSTDTITSSTTQTRTYYLNVPTAAAYDLVLVQDVAGAFMAVSQIQLTAQ
jgi:hypothetical protein